MWDVRGERNALTNSTRSSFKPDLANAGVVDWQRIRLQEQAVDDAKDEGRVPRTIECELTEVSLLFCLFVCILSTAHFFSKDLVDACVPGDVVKVCGVVKTVSTSAEGPIAAARANQSLFYVYISANSLINLKVPSSLPFIYVT